MDRRAPSQGLGLHRITGLGAGSRVRIITLPAFEKIVLMLVATFGMIGPPPPRRNQPSTHIQIKS